MTLLKKLTLTDHKQTRVKVDPKIKSRNKLVDALKQQLSIADAQAKGEVFTVEKLRWKTAEDGTRQQITKQITPRPWFWEEGGTVYLSPKVGLRQLEIEAGKPTIKVGTLKELSVVIETLIKAVEAGELDNQIVTANGRKSK